MKSAVPAELQAGDTISFTQDVPQYSSVDGYTLKLDLVGPGNKLTITATGSGHAYTFAVSSTDSEQYVPGLYRYAMYASKAGEKYTVATGTVTILENISAGANGTDARSAFMKIRDALLETLEGRASADYSEMQVSTPNGMQSITLLTLKELTEAYHHYAALAATEERKAAIARGETAPKILLQPDFVQ